MLAMRPERLGHVCCLDNYEWEVLLASRIPVSPKLIANDFIWASLLNSITVG